MESRMRHISDQVRIYHFAGLQHFSGPFPPEKGTGDLLGQQPESPLPVRYFWRAMIANMDAWVRSDTLPPPSSYPKIADRNLVPLSEYAFPAIPGVNLPHEANQAYRLDFGPDWQKGILSIQPPKVGPAFPVLVPQVDADGNERDGVHLPEITVPLATYAGWNLRDPSIGAPDQRVAFEASYLPFPRDGCGAAEDRGSAQVDRGALRRIAKTISRDTRRQWTTWCSSDGFCRKTAQPCCIAASRNGSRACNELQPKRIQRTSRNISRREVLRGSMAFAVLASAPRPVRAASGAEDIGLRGNLRHSSMGAATERESTCLR